MTAYELQCWCAYALARAEEQAVETDASDETDVPAERAAQRAAIASLVSFCEPKGEAAKAKG